MRSTRTLGLLSVAMLLAWPGGVAAQAAGPTYTVQEGDTLFGIGLTFGATVAELVAANGIQNPSAIFPGQELVIPGLEGIRGSLQVDSLAFGQTLASEALRRGLPIADLARLNRVVNPQSLIVGQPFVYVTQDPPGMSLPTSLRGSVRGGDSLLELAVGMNSDPWTLRTLNRLDRRRWTVEGETLYGPGGDRPTNGLPAGLEAVQVGPLPAVQGEALVLEVTAPAGSAPQGRLGASTLQFLESSPGRWVALQGIHAMQDPGVLTLELGLTQRDSLTQAIEIEEGGYGREALRVPEETLDPANTGPEDEMIAAVVAVVTPHKRWESTFSFPTTFFEAFPSLFGTRRSYNGSAFTYYHTGLDLYGSSATPVLAPAAGEVALASFLTVRGNTTYLDHGWGVFSGFLHQSELLVEVGDLVEPGQIIGYVGGTGRATGPHLHWEVWVGGVPVNPLTWTRTAFP